MTIETDGDVDTSSGGQDVAAATEHRKVGRNKITATEHSRDINCPRQRFTPNSVYARSRSASPRRVDSPPLHRTATEHSVARSRVRDPGIRLQKSKRPIAVRIKKHNDRAPDVGIGILISMPSYRADEESPEMIECYGEYLGHGQSKTVFDLNCPGARFHGKVLKVAKANDMEPSVFMKASMLIADAAFTAGSQIAPFH